MGAWIETKVRVRILLVVSVAPRVGAWIETHTVLFFVSLRKSHPVWVRGLKLVVLML